MPEDNQNTLPAILKQWRAIAGKDGRPLKMAKAARRLGIPYRTWQDWEYGKHQPRGVAKRLLLAMLQR